MMPVLIGLLYVNEFRSLSDLYDSHIFHFSSSSFKHLVAFFFFLSLALCVQFARKKNAYTGKFNPHIQILPSNNQQRRVMFSRFSQSFLFSERLHLPIGAILNYKLTVCSFWFHSLYSEMYIFDMPVGDIVNFNEITLFFPIHIFFLAVFFIAFLVRIICILFWYLALFFSCLFHAQMFDEILFYWFH